MIIVEKTIVKDVDVSAATCFWNTWDHEHLYYVHNNFVKANVLYENNHTAALLTPIKVPFFSFLHSTGLHVMVQHDDEVTKVINIGLFGIPSVLTMRMEETGDNTCRLTNDYKFILKGWRQILAPLLRHMIQKWNDGNWAEDGPLKERRQKMLRAGFKDYQGLPDEVEQRKFVGPIPKPTLPIRRYKESILNELL
jgi:hypothetical protein